MTNIFSQTLQEFCEFTVTMIQSYHNKQKNHTDCQVPSFFLQKSRIKIRKNDTISFPLTFLPVEFDTFNCKLIFCDETVGEFQHEIIGSVLPPDTIELIQPQNPIYVD